MKKTFILVFMVLLLAACQKPQAFDYHDVKNVKLETLGFEQTALSMDLVYYNPNGFGVDLKRVDCDIYIDNHYLGKFQLDTLMHIEVEVGGDRVHATERGRLLLRNIAMCFDRYLEQPASVVTPRFSRAI